MATVTKRSTKQTHTHSLAALAKTPTGITDPDEVTGGGLPRGRPSLVCGPPGYGKTLLAMGFDLAALEADGKLVLDHVNIVRRSPLSRGRA